MPSENDRDPWIDIIFKRDTKITGVVIQGYDAGFVASFTLQYASDDGQNLVTVVTDSNEEMVCKGFFLV